MLKLFRADLENRIWNVTLVFALYFGKFVSTLFLCELEMELVSRYIVILCAVATKFKGYYRNDTQ